jgi:hypothetical protein
MLRAAYLRGLYIVLTGAALSPLLWVSIPPLVDYPNQLAHMWILLHGHDIPALAQNYVVHWRLLPYLAMDLTVPALGSFMPIEMAGRIFVGATMLSLLLGTVALQKALFGRIGLWPLCSLLFLYNAVLFWGLMNCLFGIGMFLLAFSAWIATARWRPVPRILVFAAVASLLLILHLFAFGLYGLAVAAYELGILLEHRGNLARRFLTYCAVGTQFIPGMVLWFLSLANAGSTYTSYGDLGAKLYALVAPTTFGFGPTSYEMILWLASLGFAAAASVGGWLKLHSRMRLPVAVMIVAAVLMPNWLSGSWLADIRLPATLPFFLIGATRLSLPADKRGIALCAGAALVLLCLRLWGITILWQDGSRRFAEFRKADVAIAPGSRLLTVFPRFVDYGGGLEGIPEFVATRQPMALAHMPALAVIDRSVYVPDMFFEWMTVGPAPRNAGIYKRRDEMVTPQALVATAAPERSGVGSGTQEDEHYWNDWPHKFDYVLWIDYGASPAEVPQILAPVATGSFFHLYRVVRQ